MAEMLLINPRRRRRAASKTRAKARRRTSTRRRRNPVPALTTSAVRRRRANPARRRRAVARRRRNPIRLGGAGGNKIMTLLKDAVIGGAGAVGMDVLMGQLNNYLPVSLRRTPGTIGVGDAVKAAITVAAGALLSKPTKGLSRKMAQGALTVQAADIIKSLMPATMQLGYANPAIVTNGIARVGPIRRPGVAGVGVYASPAARTPLLNGVGVYAAPGASPLLSGRRNLSSKEGVRFR